MLKILNRQEFQRKMNNSLNLLSSDLFVRQCLISAFS